VNGGPLKGAIAIAAWAAAAALMITQEGLYWLSVLAFIATVVAVDGRTSMPRRFEWDLFERDDDDAIEGRSRPL
jgi:hypothetical protein